MNSLFCNEPGAAKERANQQVAGARQSLRQIMNLRQEAVLVLNGLLD